MLQLNLASRCPSYLNACRPDDSSRPRSHAPRSRRLTSACARPLLPLPLPSPTPPAPHPSTHLPFAALSAPPLLRSLSVVTCDLFMAMHLASMVHGSGREREAHEHHRHLQQHQQHQMQHFQPQQTHFYAPQPQPRAYPVSTNIAPSPYSSHPQAPPVEYQQQRQHPRSPPSPPVEEQKPSLPSISALLTFADGDKAASETGNYCTPSSRPAPSRY